MKSTKGTPPGAVLYARVSTKDQDTEQQLQALRKLAGDRGWRVLGEHADVVTGDHSRRRGDPPGLRHALHLVEEHRGAVLMVFSADRLVRSAVGLLHLVDRIERAGGHVVSAQDGADLDTTTDAGELLLFIKGWLARMELRLIRARTIAGLERARAAGVKLGRRVTGPDPGEVLELRAQGLSWSQVVDRVDAKNESAARRAELRGVAVVRELFAEGLTLADVVAARIGWTEGAVTRAIELAAGRPGCADPVENGAAEVSQVQTES